jgi:hypothetical protein
VDYSPAIIVYKIDLLASNLVNLQASCKQAAQKHQQASNKQATSKQQQHYSQASQSTPLRLIDLLVAEFVQESL